MDTRILIVTTALMLGTVFNPAGAEIYRWVDEQGNVEYSDTPREGAEKIDLPPPAVISMPKPSDLPARSAPEQPDADEPPYRTLKVRFPQDQSAFFSGSGDVTILTDVDPPLRPGHRFQAVLDGQVMATSRDTLTLKEVFRGTHSLVVQVVADGKVIQSTPTITFTLQRPRIKRQ
ncbi:MAG: DUF4124 domain-containing protein [Gammaproteobacteria bacterium]|nr:MAG: DUF4124 domain-containing protein [Gammaproteobacteria bacterium]